MVRRVDVYITVPLALRRIRITYILPHKHNIKLQRCRPSGRQYRIGHVGIEYAAAIYESDRKNLIGKRTIPGDYAIE